MFIFGLQEIELVFCRLWAGASSMSNDLGEILIGNGIGMHIQFIGHIVFRLLLGL